MSLDTRRQPIKPGKPLQRRTPLVAVPAPASAEIVTFADRLGRERARLARSAQRAEDRHALAAVAGLLPVFPDGAPPVTDTDPEFDDEVRAWIEGRFAGWPTRPAACDLALFAVVGCWGLLAAHHRIPKGSGGSARGLLGQASNGLLLCAAHHQWTHTHPEWAGELGLLLTKLAYVDPAEVPVRLDGGTLRVLLDNKGGFTVLAGDAA
jgi:hypothetical protein